MKITVSSTINQPIKMVWESYTDPKHVIHWNFASQDWHCPKATNYLVVGGSFSYRMEAKDESFGFDFEGIYDDIVPLEKILYHMMDQRQVEVLFTSIDNQTKVTVIFDVEYENDPELQRLGWQSILDNFKTYVEFLSSSHIY